MKTTLILAGAIALVLISMESPAFGSPAPPNEAITSLMSDTLIDNEGLVRQKRDRTSCRSDSDCDLTVTATASHASHTSHASHANGLTCCFTSWGEELVMMSPELRNGCIVSLIPGQTSRINPDSGYFHII